MDAELIKLMLSGGGLLAFCIATWLGQREQTRILRSIERKLARQEGRDEADERRAFTVTPPMGVPVLPPRRRKHTDTEEE